jgi:hypothetical protein
LFFIVPEFSLIRVIFRLQLALAFDLVVPEMPGVVLIMAPAIVALSILDTVDELALKIRTCRVGLPCLSVRDVVDPLAFNEALGRGQLTLSIGLVFPDLTPVEAAVSSDEECLVAVSDPAVEATLIERAIIVDDPAETMRKSIFPLALIVRRV